MYVMYPCYLAITLDKMYIYNFLLFLLPTIDAKSNISFICLMSPYSTYYSGKTVTVLILLNVPEDTARFAGLFQATAEGFGVQLRLFLPLGQKRAYYAVLPI